MAKAQRYTMEQIQAARKKLRSLSVKTAGKTRSEATEFLAGDIRKALRQGYSLREVRDLLAGAGVPVSLAKMQTLLGGTGETVVEQVAEGIETDTAPATGEGVEDVRKDTTEL